MFALLGDDKFINTKMSMFFYLLVRCSVVIFSSKISNKHSV